MEFHFFFFALRAIQIWKSLKLMGDQTNKPDRPLGMGFSHSRIHQSKTYTANDRLSRNTGMRCKDNKFNHGEINCNPNNIPDSNQLPT
jgi:hypothetical protein